MTLGDRKSLTLTPERQQALAAAVTSQQPDFAPRVERADTDVVEQPFFETRILDVTSAVPTPSRRLYVAWPFEPERFLVLTGHIEHLNEVAAGDTPGGLEDPTHATEYMTYADAWTTASTGRELAITSLDDIPWWEHLDDDQKAQIEDVKTNLGPNIAEQGLFMEFPKYELRRWVLVGQTLVERVLTVSMNGQFSRVDTVHRRGLPVPPGRIWGHKDGRFVPVG